MKDKVLYIENADIFQGNTLILNEVNLSIHKGEFAYLIGKTGSGKSSLLKTLYGALTLTNGTGAVAGFDLRKLKEKDVPYLRRKIGIVFQDFNLLTDRDVHKNLEFVLQATGWTDKSKINNRIEEVLQMVGLKTKGFKMPFELSGGEQQRIVIARALLNHPEVIIADEPTGNLDPDTSEDILELIRSICKESETAVLMATHDYSIIERFPADIYRCINQTINYEQNVLV